MVEADVSLPTWSEVERESFFAAIERHRRATWRVTWASRIANALLALTIATLMAPLFYAVLALLMDIGNLVAPVPDLVAWLRKILHPVFDAPGAVPFKRWVELLLCAALPGLVWMALVLALLSRALRGSVAFGAGEFGGRTVDTGTLAELRLKNVVSEMALAANLPEPRVAVLDSAVLNAGVFGRDEAHATIVVSSGLLAELDRAQIQGVAAHLLASIANGDLSIGWRAAVSLSLFNLTSRLTGVLTDAVATLRPFGRLLGAALWPTPVRARQLEADLSDPFAADRPQVSKAVEAQTADSGTRSGRSDWRTWLWLPLAGPVVITGFLGGLVNLMLLNPLLALAWRQRKYMADATAVRLTRDPDALAAALEKVRSTGGFAPWAAHLSWVQSRSTGGLLSGSAVPLFPSPQRRLAALAKLGAHLQSPPRRLPLPLVVVLSVLFTIIGLLGAVAAGLLIYVSVPLSALFTGIPFAILHVLLRWLGH